MKPFEPNKTAEELGIDKSRKFVVAEREKGSSVGIFENGEIVRFTDHGTTALFKNDDGNEEEMRWSELAYAEEKEPEPYAPRVGDRVTIEALVDEIDSHGNVKVNVTNDEVGTIWFGGDEAGKLKLLSRRPPRKVTMEEVREKFGEDVEIIAY